jgi:cell division protein FtsZ
MGSGKGDERAAKAIRAATNYELLEYSMKGATGLIYNVIGHEISMEEMDVISTSIQSETSKDAKIIFGLADPFDEFLGEAGEAGEANDEIRITVVASGMQPQKSEVEQEKKILKEFKVEEVELPAILRKGPPRGF